MVIYGLKLSSKSMVAIKTSDPNYTKSGHYFVTMLTFKPIFFKSKN